MQRPAHCAARLGSAILLATVTLAAPRAAADSAHPCLLRAAYHVEFYSANVAGQHYLDQQLAAIDVPCITGAVVYDPAAAFENPDFRVLGRIIDLDIRIHFLGTTTVLDEADDPGFAPDAVLYEDRSLSLPPGFNFGVPDPIRFPDPLAGPTRLAMFTGLASLQHQQDGYEGRLVFADPTPRPHGSTIPAPTAALAGVALLGLLSCARRRATHGSTPTPPTVDWPGPPMPSAALSQRGSTRERRRAAGHPTLPGTGRPLQLAAKKSGGRG